MDARFHKQKQPLVKQNIKQQGKFVDAACII